MDKIYMAKPTINPDLCVLCGECEEVCPMEAIEIICGEVRISDDCIYCGTCAGECAQEAIDPYPWGEPNGHI